MIKSRNISARLSYSINCENNIEYQLGGIVLSLEVIAQRCPQNHRCPSIKVCPVGALSQVSVEAPSVDYDKCIECGKCVSFCPKNALVLNKER